jgi:nanoRNase/pAp phosphatase (c-di-AMP/oligoRNAs hydrolase)
VYVLIEDFDLDITKLHHNHHLLAHDVGHDDYCFIALDLNETYRLGRFKKPYLNAQIKINIDHHQGNHTDADTVVSMPDRSSTSEIIYKLICVYGREYLDLDIAEDLYTGIMTDTSGFARRLSSETLSIAQRLINLGVDYETLIRGTFSHRTLYELKALGQLIEEIHFDECLHYVSIDKSLEEYKKDVSESQIDYIANDIVINKLFDFLKANNNMTAKECSCIYEVSIKKNSSFIKDISSIKGITEVSLLSQDGESQY